MTHSTNFRELANLEQNGLTGFVSISLLQESQCRNIPSERGVYLILYTLKSKPRFLNKSIGGHFKGKDPTVSIAELESKWIDSTVVIYIGKATNLKKRLWQYMCFGQGKPSPHIGGRFIWQIHEPGKLLVCWKSTTNENPREIEKSLVREFESQYGKLPFANVLH